MFFENIKNCNYISVRDKSSYDKIRQINEDVVLYPDSVILISDLFEQNCLKKKISDSVKSFTENCEKFIAVQFCLSYFKVNESDIIASLNEFKEQHPNVKILFVPVGYAMFHDDLSAMKIASSKIQGVDLIENLTVWDIMFLISNSSFFVGSSLHGIVTAMSFNVPYIGLPVPNQSKICDFIDTWGVPISKIATSIHDINRLYGNVSYTELSESADKMKILARENYRNIFENL